MTKTTSGGSKTPKNKKIQEDQNANAEPKHGGHKSAETGRGAGADDTGLAIKMLHDRLLVNLDIAEGDRTTSGGILIPATVELSKRLSWALVEAAGPNVRTIEIGDRVLFNPDDRYEVEVRGAQYLILRERDIHAVAAKRLDDSGHGLYL